MSENSILQNAGCDALEQAPVIMAIYDPDLNFYWANKACRDFFRLSMSQIQGRTCRSLWGLERPCPDCPPQKCLQTGQPAEAELIPQTREHWPQSQACWQVKATPLRDQSGRIGGVMVVVLDITAGMQTEAALEETSLQLGQRVKELTCLYQLSQLLKDPSIPEPEILQRTVELIPPSWQYPDITCARLVWKGREYATENFQETEWQQASDILLNGEKKGYIQVCYLEKRPTILEGPFLNEERNLIDIVAENLGQYLGAKQIDRQKRRSDEYSRAIIQSSPLPVYSLDLEGKVLTWNSAAEQVLGWKAEEVIGRPLPTVPSDKQTESEALKARIFQEGGATGLELVRQKKGGRRIDVSLSSAPIHDEQGEVIGIMSSLEDITQRKKAERILFETKENLSITLNSIGDGVITTDIQGRVTRMNPVAEALTGWKLEQAANRPLEEVFHIFNAQSGQRAENPVQKVLSTGIVVGLANHTKLISWQGEEYQIADSGSPIKDTDGNTLGVILVFRDVTAEYQMQSSLEESEHRFRSIVEGAPDPIFIQTDQKFAYLNPAACRLFGIPSAQELIGTPVMNRFHPHFHSAVRERIRRLNEGQESVHELMEQKYLRVDGSEVWVETSGEPIVYEGKRGALVFARDISQRMETEKALRKSEEKFRNLFETMTQGVVYQDVEGKIVSANPAAERILGLSLDQMQGRTSMDPRWQAVNEDKAELPGERHPAMLALRTGRPVNNFVQGIFNPRINDYVWILVNSIPQFSEGTNKVAQVYSTFLDITERKNAEEALRQSEARYRELFNSIRDAILVSDRDRNIVDCNPAFTELFGYTLDEIKGKKTFEIYEDMSQYEDMGRKLRKNNTPKFIYTVRYKKKSGQVFSGETNVFYLKNSKNQVAGFIGLIRDISEREKAEAEKDRLEMQLRQAQKMEAIGRLAGGVAHDFNNLLTTITGNAEIGLMDVEKGQELYDFLQEIKEAGERAGNLTRQLLAFSRRQIMQPEILDLNDLILDLEKMLRRLIGEDISLETHLPPGLGFVEVDPGQMEQVIMNLAVNARDAMPGGGKLTIETANVDLDESYAHGHGHLITPGPYIMLAVSDSGTGMSPQMLAQVFDPFFTTKEKGKGTGLGLSTVYGIVKQSKGNIWVYSEPGKGTTFKIYLPKTEKDQPSQDHKPDFKPILQGHETVLVVEDDPSVRKIAVKNLILFGYTVYSAASGDEALSFCREHKGDIDVLLTDVIMPDLSGKDLVQALQQLGLRMQVVFMSGYTDNAIVHHGVLDPGICFLQKPFTPESLARKIREALDQGERR